MGTKNVHNDGIWENSREDVDKCGLGSITYQKSNKSVMLWGGITSEGLIPKDKPIFFKDEFLKDYCKKIKKLKITLDNVGYAKFIESMVIPILHKDLKEDLTKYYWQDDNDSKHRTAHVLATIDKLFHHRIRKDKLGPKMADILPIEHVWGVTHEKLLGKKFESKEKLKHEITVIWKTFTPKVCNEMMMKIPRGLQLIIEKKGNQVHKSDFQ